MNETLKKIGTAVGVTILAIVFALAFAAFASIDYDVFHRMYPNTDVGDYVIHRFLHE